MRTILTVSLLALAACAPAAKEAGFQLLDSHAYSSFVANWEPDDQPLCAAFASEADWNKVMHPAATMGGPQVFAPPETVWKDHAVLLLSRVVDGGDNPKGFVVSDAKRSGDALDVTYSFKPPPSATFQVKDFFLIEVPGPLPAKITFTENGKLVCTTTPGGKFAGHPGGTAARLALPKTLAIRRVPLH